MTAKICSIDPAFKHCAFVVMTTDFKIHHHENVDFLANHQKTDQTTYTIALWRAIKNKVNEINANQSPTLWLIEAQIGKFACVQVHSMLVSAISEIGGRVVSMSPRNKLKDNLGLEGYVESDSNKYNQNKNKSKAIASHFVSKTYQKVSLDRDVSDAILQCVYYIQNELKHSLRYEQFQLQEPKAEIQSNEETVAKPKAKPRAKPTPKVEPSKDDSDKGAIEVLVPQAQAAKKQRAKPKAKIPPPTPSPVEVELGPMA